MPSTPISVAVSKPRPNMKPIGYICHDCEMRRNMGRKIRASSSRPAKRVSISSSIIFSPRRARPKADHMPLRTNRLAMAIATRNSTDTLVLIRPPTFLNTATWLCIAAAEAAIAMVPDKRLDGAEERLVKLMCEAKVEQPTPALHRRAVRACQASSFSLFALLCQHLSAFDPRESTLVPLDLRAFEALQSAMQVIDIKAAPERRHLLGQR